MSKEGYTTEKKEGESKVVLERLQSYLKDKRVSESSESSVIYSKPNIGLVFEETSAVPTIEDNSSNVLRDVLNHKKAELLRQPEVIAFLKTLSADLKK
ncbi:unnamed protein product [Leptosia nina]|uniref:Regulatory factor X-associated protein RFXANK-binding domain-containing protein n=1 Tax=Leptosia nina TaxID=320188 RepID=A0AAV1J6T7_9NEOP